MGISGVSPQSNTDLHLVNQLLSNQNSISETQSDLLSLNNIQQKETVDTSLSTRQKSIVDLIHQSMGSGQNINTLA